MLLYYYIFFLTRYKNSPNDMKAQAVGELNLICKVRLGVSRCLAVRMMHFNVRMYSAAKDLKNSYLSECTYFAFFGSMPFGGPGYVELRHRGGLFAFCGTKGCLACAGDVCEP